METRRECLQVRNRVVLLLSWVPHLFQPGHASLECKCPAMTYELRVCFGTAGDIELAVNGWGVWDWLSEHGRSISM